ncbi:MULTISPECIES: hypothetical protein [Pantoea]|uniref:Host cell division inhibitor Icd-like protein n=1 Tax=Pantoea anthophila TaxID=470931 RepID=A0ABY2ZHM7_9GAMM|nr:MULTISPECIES: hypothetical protein [Pantoea]KAA5974398.1 hypothetical protein F3I51_06635 [Pantoea sp. M_6]KAA5978340.1 hypothetical protein F3I52_08365 [Pantoea sp. M_8]KAA5989905.1 hypothetical protein F3I47_13705 [Pantoea sp. M_10]KAA6002864.1 hypothetical protein F3I50_00965 [Pantoea sp. M_5]TPV33683.1 hypothetical protein FJW00_01155 [Pantoea anthophila]
MKIQYIATPAEATLHIRTCVFRAFFHERVVRAAVTAAPDARVTHTGTFVIHTRIAGDPVEILKATREARREEEE